MCSITRILKRIGGTTCGLLGGIDRLVSNKLVFEDLKRSGWIDTTDPLVRQDLARIESAYRIGRLLVVREVLGQAPTGFSAATSSVSRRPR